MLTKDEIKYYQRATLKELILLGLLTILIGALPKLLPKIYSSYLEKIPHWLLCIIILLLLLYSLLKYSYCNHLLNKLEKKYIIKFGIKWDTENELAPICPNCDKPLSEWGMHELKEPKLMSNFKQGFNCLNCDKIITLKDENDDVSELIIFPKEAKEIIKNSILKTI